MPVNEASFKDNGGNDHLFPHPQSASPFIPACCRTSIAGLAMATGPQNGKPMNEKTIGNLESVPSEFATFFGGPILEINSRYSTNRN